MGIDAVSPQPLRPSLAIIRVALVTLAVGWLVSALIGGGFALLQYQEVARSFPPAEVQAAFQARIDRELWRGSLLIFAHCGVLCGAFWWQVSAALRGVPSPRFGLACGVLVAGVEAAAGWWLQTPPLFLIPLLAIIVAVGWYAGSDQRPK